MSTYQPTLRCIRGGLKLRFRLFLQGVSMKNSRLYLMMVGLVMSLSACVVVPRQASYPNYSNYSSNAGYGNGVPTSYVEVDVAPPAPMVETMGVAPSPGYFWINGVWVWRGGRHVWAPGYWQAPRVGFYWESHRWQRGSRHWHFNPGGWRRHR